MLQLQIEKEKILKKIDDINYAMNLLLFENIIIATTIINKFKKK
mgnify:CR=1 FL=1